MEKIAKSTTGRGRTTPGDRTRVVAGPRVEPQDGAQWLARLGPEALMTRNELARLFGVTPGTVYTWEREGMPVEKGGIRGKVNLYRPSRCVPWRTARLEQPGGMPQAATERARKDAARAALDEFGLKVKLGDYVLKADVLDGLRTRIVGTRAKLLALPRALAPELAGPMAPSAVEAILSRRIRDTLTELSEAIL